MNNIVIVNAAFVNPAAFQPLPYNKVNTNSDAVNDALTYSFNYARSLPQVQKVVVFITENSKAKIILDRAARLNFSVVIEPEWDLKVFFSHLKDLSGGYDNLIYFYADCPLLDRILSNKMYENHLNYFADYTFADGYPYGLTPEVLRSDIVPVLYDIANNNGSNIEKTVSRETIFNVIKCDINSFDIETEIAPVDQRMLRISLTADSRRDFQLLKNIMQSQARTAEEVTTVIERRPELLRSLPAFFPIQIIEGCPQICSYCPYGIEVLNEPGKRSEMALTVFDNIVKQISDFCDDAVLSVSLWGEPAFYSDFVKLVELVSEYSKLNMLIETSGIGWSQSVLRDVIALPNAPKWILSLDSIDEKVYRKLRGSGFSEAVKNTEWLLENDPENVYVQAVRMNENEEQLERFYKEWNKKTENIIIQKYDSFAQRLPDRQVADLTPLSRHPCWHNKREVAILIDGTVPLCREDFKAEISLGNILEDGIENVWESGQEIYLRHLQENYPDLCSRCDEFYTFNF